MIRKSINDPWREVSWDEAIGYAASEFRRIQAKYGKDSIGGITSSRCTNEETYLVQKLVRAAFGNNNVDTCARVCHSPTGYGLGQTYGTSAGTQTFKSVEKADVIMVIGANPTDGHPVFASRMKKRLREGAKPDRDRPAPHRHREVAARPGRLPPAAEARHQRGHDHRAGPRGRHRRPAGRRLHRRALRRQVLPAMARVRGPPRELARGHGSRHRRAGGDIRGAARLYATAGNAAIYYGLGVTEHAQGSTMVMGIANLAMATGNVGREGVGVNPLRGQNNVQGSCDMGSFPHELPGYRHVSDSTVRAQFEAAWGVTLSPSRACASPTCSTRRRPAASWACIARARTSCSPTRTRSTWPRRSWRWNASWCRTSS
jgi:formate dehydrogenase major subunit